MKRNFVKKTFLVAPLLGLFLWFPGAFAQTNYPIQIEEPLVAELEDKVNIHEVSLKAIFHILNALFGSTPLDPLLDSNGDNVVDSLDLLQQFITNMFGDMTGIDWNAVVWTDIASITQLLLDIFEQNGGQYVNDTQINNLFEEIITETIQNYYEGDSAGWTENPAGITTTLNQVGIGITTSLGNPMLRVEGGASTGPIARVDNTVAGASQNGFLVTTADNTSGSWPLWVRGNGGTTTGLIVRSNGNVGIGTTNPSALLDARGAVRLGVNHSGTIGANSLAVGNSNQATGDETIALGNTAVAGPGEYAIAMGVNSTASGNVSMSLGEDVTASGDYAMGINLASTGPLTVSGQNAFAVNVGNTPVDVTQSSVIALLGGNVGIGTTNPTTLLTVNGDTTTTNLTVSDTLTAENINATNLDVTNLDVTELTINNETLNEYITQNITDGTVLPTCTNGQVLKYDGTNWVCSEDGIGESTTFSLGTCANGEVLKYDGTNWACALDDVGEANVWTAATGGINYAGGNVGIGTNAPTAKLSVSQNSTNTTLDQSANYPLKLQNTGWISNMITGIEFWNGGNKTVPTSRIISQMNGSGAGGENLLFQTQSSDAANPNQTQPTTKLAIKADGNVGIGTTTPGAKLEVAGQVKITGGTPGAGKVLTSDATGLATWTDLPAAVTAPRYSLETVATGVLDSDGAQASYSRVNADSFHTNGLGDGQMYMEGYAIDANSTIRIGTGLAGGQSAQDVFLGGNVGIGTASPSEKLEVEGAIRFGRQYSTGNYQGVLDNRNTIADVDGAAKDDVYLGSDADVMIKLDTNSNQTSNFTIYDSGNASRFNVSETGDVTLAGKILGFLKQTTNSTYDVWLQGGASDSGKDRNLGLLGTDNNSGDTLYLNYAGEYEGGLNLYTGGGNGLIIQNNWELYGPGVYHDEGYNAITEGGQRCACDTGDGHECANTIGYPDYNSEGSSCVDFVADYYPCTGLNALNPVCLTAKASEELIDDEYTYSRVRNSTQAFRITRYGNTRIGSSAVGSEVTYRLGVDGDSYFEGNIRYTGTIADVSDERLKDNIATIGSALDTVKSLRGVEFNMKETPDKKEFGFIAQEVQKVLPAVVNIVDDENGYLGVSYIELIPILTEAIKAQQQQIEALQAQVNKLTK